MKMAGVPSLGDLRTRNRSVEDVAAHGDDTMNVWQTLEVISGNNLRKKYHYDGYSDADNVLRTLTPLSHGLDNFSDKATAADSSKKFGQSGDVGATKTDHGDLDVTQASTKDIGDRRQKGSATVSKRKSKLIQEDRTEKDENLLLTLECTDIVQCSFNIPRISARLERLMGTNVVRLTDRKYMKELRERIDEDYRMQLANRIKNREIKELERERNLILTGQTDTIPDELSLDPIFVVNKRANIEILKRRAKLKTNREKNADRLSRQGLKWERERLRYEEQERIKQDQLTERRKEQKALVEQYKEEDAIRGLDLLRINDVEWQDCEQSLRDFMEAERNKMKERSWRVPTPFSSDPLDIANVIRARKKFREEQRRLRLELAQKKKLRQLARQNAAPKRFAKKVMKAVTALRAFADGIVKPIEIIEEERSIYLDDDEASGIESSSTDVKKKPVQKNIKQERAAELEAQMEHDVASGYLITKEQHANLRYADSQIMKLRDSANIRDLYKIAEMIITYQVEEELPPGEEMLIEEDDDDD